MTSIGDQTPGALQATMRSSAGIAAGQTVQARVLGATRHGVSVSIGRDTFQLTVPARFADSATLTLQSTTSGPEQRVQIIAEDNRPLTKPIVGQLIASTAAKPQSASVVVARGQIEVSARPIASDGKILGPSVTLHLQTSPTATGIGPTTGQAGIAGGSGASQESVGPKQVRTPVERPSSVLLSSMGQSVRSIVPSAPMNAAPSTSPPSPSAIAPAMSPSGGPVPTPHLSGPSSAFSNVDRGATPDRASGNMQKPESTAQPNRGAMPIPGSALPATAPTKPNSVVQVDQKVLTDHRITEPKASAQTPGSIAPQMPPKPSGPMAATVIGRTDDGNVVLKAEGRFMRIEQAVDLPIGTTLQATYAQATPTLPSSIELGPIARSQTLLTKLVELLNEIDRQSLRAGESDQPMITKRLPAPDKHLASRFLSLFSAANSGQAPDDVMMSSLRANQAIGAQDDRLPLLIRELGSVASEPLVDGWKTLLLPLESDPTQAVSLFYQDQEIDSDEQMDDAELLKSKAKRAIFDVSFSQLGRCQIDTFCQERRFDLMIRSETALNSEDQRELTTLFHGALDIAGLTGEIGFSVGGFFEPMLSHKGARELQT